MSASRCRGLKSALAQLGGPVRDELEPLDGVSGHWTSDPNGTVLLVRKPT
ncbi:hypothetical protein [Pseudoxanthomonas sp. UC19_8]